MGPGHLGTRSGVANFRGSDIKDDVRFDSYWRENLAREMHRHRTHQQNPGMDRLLNPHGFDQGLPTDRKTLGAKDPFAQLYGTFYADQVQAASDMYQGAAGKSRYRYGVHAMSKYHKWLTGSFSNPELARTFARPPPPFYRRAPHWKFETEQRMAERHHDAPPSTGRSCKSDIQRVTTHNI
jgi:IS5 family transposase